MCMSVLLNASPDEVTDTTSSWQSFNSPDLANERPGYFTPDRIPAHSTHLVSQVTRSIRAEPDGDSPCPRPSGSAQDHMPYYPQDVWNLDTTPPSHCPDAAYGPSPANGTTTTTYHYDYPSSGSDSHHGSDRGAPYVPYPDCQSPLSASSSFTPINGNRSTAQFPSPSSKVSGTALC